MPDLLSSIMFTFQIASISWFELLAGSSCVLLFCLYHLSLPRPIPGIPYNKNATKCLLGDLPNLAEYQKRTKEQRRWFASQNQKLNSPICQVFIHPFGKPSVVVSDFRETLDMCSRRLKEFDRGERPRAAWAGVIPHQMLSYHTADPKFKQHRELMRDLMTPNFLNKVSAPEVYSKVSTLVKLWQEKCLHADERPFDGKIDIQRAALDTITAVSFGLDDGNSATRRQLKDIMSKSTGFSFTESKQNVMEFPILPLTAELNAIVTIIRSAAVGFSSPFPRLHHWFLRQFRDMKDAITVKERWTRNEIDKAIKAISENGLENTFVTRSALEYIVLREATAAKKTERQPRFHRRRIYDELLGFIIAGHDTTGSTLSWGVRYIADTPEAQKKLRCLLQEAFLTALNEHRQPTVDEITSASIPYLDAVIEETLRLSAVIPIVSREAQVDTTILGHAIPKGTEVYFTFNGPSLMKPAIDVPETVRSESSQNAKNRCGEWHANDIERFIPERWIDVDEKGAENYNPMKGPILSFGSGPRGCYGRRLGYLQLRIFWVLLIWNFEFLPVPAELRTQEVVEGVTVEPLASYVRLRKVEN